MSHRAIARTASARLALLLLAAVAAIACAPEPSASLQRVSHPSSLSGTTWRVVAIQGRQPPVGRDLTLVFGPNGEVEGDGGCNSFGGIPTYVPATGALHIEALVSTKRACVEPARNEVEAAYLQALRTVAVASIDPDGRLVLTGAGAEVVLEVGPQQVGPGVTLPPSNAP